MSAIEKQIIQEFVDWRDELTAQGPDLSIDGFLAWRDRESAVRRIEKALSILAPVGNDGTYPSDYNADVARRYYDVLTAVGDTLQGEDNWVESRTFDGTVTVTRA